MDTTTQAQLRQLQNSVRHQRYAILALSAIIAGAGLIAATRADGDATFDKITCKEWVVVDINGKTRIKAAVTDNDQAAVQWIDLNQHTRIAAATSSDGSGSVCLLDTNEKVRISAGTRKGEASTQWSDASGKTRFSAGTNEGLASTDWFDASGRLRFVARTSGDGQASAGWNDRDGKLQFGQIEEVPAESPPTKTN